MEGIENELGLLRLTLNNHKPQLEWKERSEMHMLRLPRINDTIFDERFQYPEKSIQEKHDITLGKLSEVKIVTIPKEKTREDHASELNDEAFSSICSEEKEEERLVDESEKYEKNDTLVSIQKVQDLLATLPQFIVDMEEELEKLDEINLEVCNTSGKKKSERESNTEVPLTRNSEVDEIVDQEEEKLSDDEQNAEDLVCEKNQIETEDSHIIDDGDHDDGSKLDCFTEQNENSTSPTQDTIASNERGIQSDVDLANDMEVQQILDTYTKDQILKELAWTRQALQQRSQYLQNLTKEKSSDKP
jgi:hypothetical protein